MEIIKILAICGILSPIIYTAMWVFIGSFQTVYSHIKTDISSLYAVGAPNKRVSQFLITISSALLFYFTLD